MSNEAYEHTIEMVREARDKAARGTLTQEELDRIDRTVPLNSVLMASEFADDSIKRTREADNELV